MWGSVCHGGTPSVVWVTHRVSTYEQVALVVQVCVVTAVRYVVLLSAVRGGVQYSTWCMGG